MGILMQNSIIWLLAAAVLLPHALARKDPDLSISKAGAAAVNNAMAEHSAGNKRRAEITIDGNGDKRAKVVKLIG